MSKSIHTLIPDIQELVTTKGWCTDVIRDQFSDLVGKTLQQQFNKIRPPARLRLSEMGPKCPKAFWHSLHTPELAEPLPPWAEVKFSFGHILEALAIMLAKAAGHTVEGEQDELILDGVVGHRDCVIDGCVVDVKSVSSRGYQRFKDGSIGHSDSFGWLDQLDGYVLACANDPIVKVKDKGYELPIDKTLGHMCLYEHTIRETSIRNRIQTSKEIAGRTEAPGCTCGTVAYGESGNMALDVTASYSAFKHTCFPHLRTFLYANGPVYFSRVQRHPAVHVKEVDKHGKLIYN